MVWKGRAQRSKDRIPCLPPLLSALIVKNRWRPSFAWLAGGFPIVANVIRSYIGQQGAW